MATESVFALGRWKNVTQVLEIALARRKTAPPLPSPEPPLDFRQLRFDGRPRPPRPPSASPSAGLAPGLRGRGSGGRR
jgi:hypothetical protein